MAELYINSIPPKNPNHELSVYVVCVVWRFPKLPMEVLVELKRVKLWSWGSASQWENLQRLMQALMKQGGVRYCWWKKSCTTWYGKYPIIYMVLAPSQVAVWDFFHQQYHPNIPEDMLFRIDLLHPIKTSDRPSPHVLVFFVFFSYDENYLVFHPANQDGIESANNKGFDEDSTWGPGYDPPTLTPHLFERWNLWTWTSLSRSLLSHLHKLPFLPTKKRCFHTTPIWKCVCVCVGVFLL